MVFFQFEIIINILVGSFRFIWMPMLWVYGYFKYFNYYSTARGSTLDDSRQIQKSIPAL